MSLENWKEHGRLKKVKKNRKVKISSSEYQTLGQRVKWLRLAQQPPMTQRQLSTIAGCRIRAIIDIEKDRPTYFQFELLNRISNALGCRILINLRPLNPKSIGSRRSYRAKGDCLPILPELPPCPERTGTASVQARARALKTLRWPWKAKYQKELLLQRIKTSGISDTMTALQERVDKQPKLPDTP